MRKFFALGALVCAVSPAFALVTIATHDDPSGVASNPVFSVTNALVSGSWTQPGLTLSIPANGLVFNNVFMSASIVRTGASSLGAGSVTYYTTDINNPIFKITLDSGFIAEPFLVSGSYLVASNVQFSGTGLAGLTPITETQFSFSFANPVSTQNGNTYTASMTSSGNPVPEPATMTLLGLGVAAYAARKRRS